LFAQTYKNYELATVRYPVLEVIVTVEPFENSRGFSLRVLRAEKARHKKLAGKRAASSSLLPSRRGTNRFPEVVIDETGPRTSTLL
jgi:hypothetical protein